MNFRYRPSFEIIFTKMKTWVSTTGTRIIFESPFGNPNQPDKAIRKLQDSCNLKNKTN